MRNEQNPLIGKVIRAVFLASDGAAIRFDLEGGESLIVRADGDCCSHSWIEEVQNVEQLIGTAVVSVEDVDLPEPTKTPTKSEYGGEVENRYGHYEEEMQYYGCKITTQKGYALIDYRNSSNGYYGGNLAWPGEYFYGGVHGQNGSIDEVEWKEVTP